MYKKILARGDWKSPLGVGAINFGTLATAEQAQNLSHQLSKDNKIWRQTKHLLGGLAMVITSCLYAPTAEAFLLVGSHLTDEVLKYDEITGEFLGVFGQANMAVSGLDGTEGVVYGPDGHVYVASANTDRVLKYHGKTGKFLGVFGDANYEASGLDFPGSLTFGPDGNLYVISFLGSKVVKYDGKTGKFLGNFAQQGINGASGLAFSPDGKFLYVSSYGLDLTLDYGVNQILKYDADTGDFLGIFAQGQNSDNGRAEHLLFGPDGNLYVSNLDLGNQNVGQVLRYSPDGTFLDVFVSGLMGAVGLRFGSDGNFYVSNVFASEVRRYDSQGNSLGVFGEANKKDSGLHWSAGLVFSPAKAVPEPTAVVSLLALGAVGAGSQLKRKQK
jgi:DNA-binding beta-propeller fold protein YncE